MFIEKKITELSMAVLSEALVLDMQGYILPLCLYTFLDPVSLCIYTSRSLSTQLHSLIHNL